MQRKPSDYFLLIFYIICITIAILLLSMFNDVEAAEGIRMRRFYDAETGIVCYTAYGDSSGLSTSCVKVNACQLEENPKYFTLK